MSTLTTGTGTVTLGSAIAGYATLAEAGVSDADEVSYVIEDGSDFEIGTGTYTTSGTTLSRDTVTLSKISGTAGTSKINLSGNATVFLTARAEDILTGDPEANESPQFTNLTQTGYHDLTEISEPSSPAANVARVFSYDDGGTTRIAYKDSAGTVRDFHGGLVSIKDFGATGDGSTDDYTAVQAAVDFANTNGALIYVPSGTYLLSDRVTRATFSNAWGLVGAGRDLVTFRKTNADTDSVFQVEESDGIIFEGFHVDGNYSTLSAGNHGVVFSNCSNVIVRDLRITDYLNSAILIFTGTVDTYYNNVVENCDVDGLGTANNGINIVDCNESGMRGCVVRNCPGSPGLGLQLKNQCVRGFIEDCYVEDCVVGIGFGQDAGNGVTYSRVSNVVCKANNHGISTGEAVYNNFSNIVIDAASAASALDPIRLLSDSTSNVFNNITAIGVAGAREAVRFSGNSSDNYVHFSYIDKATGNLVGFDSGSARNFVRIEKTEDDFETIVGKVRDNSGVTTNDALYSKDISRREPDVNAQAGTSYTLALTDRSGVVTMSNSSANELTIPTNASVAFPTNTIINVIMLGSGTTSITGDTGVTVNGVSAGSGDIQTRYQAVSLLKIATNTWIASGDIGTVA